MGDYADKLQEKAGEVLQPGERVLSAIRVQPRGTNTGLAVGGLIGGAVAGSQAKKAQANMATGSLATKWPAGRFAVGLTEQRLLAFNYTAMGKPKEMTAEFPLQDVAQVALESKKLTQAVKFEFSDTSSIVVECGAREKVGDFISAFEKAKANREGSGSS